MLTSQAYRATSRFAKMIAGVAVLSLNIPSLLLLRLRAH